MRAVSERHAAARLRDRKTAGLGKRIFYRRLVVSIGSHPGGMAEISRWLSASDTAG
jgi:hypothetical protein